MRVKTLLFLLLLQSTCWGQNEYRNLVDSVWQRARVTSLYTNQITWDSLYQVMDELARDAKSLEDLAPAFTALLNGMGDKHGQVIAATNYAPIAAFTDWAHLNHPDQRVRDPELGKKIYTDYGELKVQNLGDGTVYLRIPGMPPGVDIEEKAEEIRTALFDLAKTKPDLWIVDLRYNWGGNMHPMVAGLAPLIGEGIVGGLTDLEGNRQYNWKIEGGNFYLGEYRAVRMPDEPRFEEPPRVAVLSSRWTVSSGEVLATCFQGRPNTRFFGEATGGFTTNNNWEVVGEKVILTISTGIFCDRRGRSFVYNIPVEEEAPFEPGGSLEEDPGIQKARDWLKSER